MIHTAPTDAGWTVRLTCDVAGCRAGETAVASTIDAAHAVLERAGWRRNVPVPVTRPRVASRDDLGNPLQWADAEDTIAGDRCPKCAEEQADG